MLRCASVLFRHVLLSGPKKTGQLNFLNKYFFTTSTNSDTISFGQMFRESQFVRLGEPDGAIVQGKIVHVIDDDLYIDFGGKFNCVCKRPQRNGHLYRRGTDVRLRLHDFELSSRFLGSEKDITLLEADCTLLGLLGEEPASRKFGSSRRSSTRSLRHSEGETNRMEYGFRLTDSD